MKAEVNEREMEKAADRKQWERQHPKQCSRTRTSRPHTSIKGTTRITTIGTA